MEDVFRDPGYVNKILAEKLDIIVIVSWDDILI